MARLNAQVAGLHPSSHPGQGKDLETDIRIRISDISTRNLTYKLLRKIFEGTFSRTAKD
jgi:hypothetical protein